MDTPVKYKPSVAWKTVAYKVHQLTRESESDPASFRIYVSPVDQNDLGAGETEEGFYFTDFLGNPFPVIAKGAGYIDVSDSFRTRECPTSGKIGIVHKSAYKGYSLYLPSSAFLHLHPLAQQNNNKYAMSILWGNDPNPRRIAFTNVSQPDIADYRNDLTDMDGVQFNPEEDYGQNPVFEIWQLIEPGKYSKLGGTSEPQIIRGEDGKIDSVLFSGTGELITGYIVIKR